jgi:hypothetical protein
VISWDFGISSHPHVVLLIETNTEERQRSEKKHTEFLVPKQSMDSKTSSAVENSYEYECCAFSVIY